VIVANMQSKSVLRAVAGQISEDIPGVDYFPSYESVVLTRQPYVWEDDLAHVSPDFVGRIMSRVYAAYVPGASPEALAVEDEILRFQTLVGEGAYDEAKAIYLTLGAEALDSVSPRFDACAAELWLLEGDRDLALKHGDRAFAGAVDLGGADFDSLLRAGMIYEKLGLDAPAGEARNRAFEALRIRPTKAKSALSRYLLSERHDYAAVLLPFMEAELADDLQVLEAVAHGYKKTGHDADAERTCRKGLSRDPDNSRMKAILFTMIRADPARAAEATSLAEDLLRDDPENPTWLRRLCTTYLKAGRHGDAASLARRLLAVEPENAQGRRVLERSLAMAGDLDEPGQRAIGRRARAR
jgi:tetratricopeptide (TPR) repeat protein